VREIQTWAVAEALAHRSAEAALERPDRARELAALGSRVAELAACEGPFRRRLLGYTLAFGENAARADDDLSEAERLADRRRDPGLLFIVRFNHAALLCRLGRHALAVPLVRDLESLAKSAGALSRTRLRWLRGSMAFGVGRWEAAEADLEAARRDLAERKAVREHALISLELAVLLCRRTRFGQPPSWPTVWTGSFRKRRSAARLRRRSGSSSTRPKDPA
jgi:hypothetical protein